jgi:hypothetical protein
MRETMSENNDKQLLHLVFGGELADVQDVRFEDLDQTDLVGLYPNYAEAYDAWKSKSHLHRLLDPETDEPGSAD